MTTNSAPGYTAEQRRALETRDVSIALSAGAGCGKTFVLTERFLAHLDPADLQQDEPLELSQIVAITFTDLAAREMRDRVREKCYQRLRAADADQADYWQGLLRLIDSARISTIHAFCAALLRSHAVEARVDPQFVVMEQAQAQTMLAELLDDFLRERLTEQEPQLVELAARYGLGQLRSRLDLLVNASEATERRAWLERSADEQLAAWRQYHTGVVLPSLARQIATSPATRRVLDILERADYSHAKMRERAALLQAELPQLAVNSENLAGRLSELHEAAKVQGAGTKKDWSSEHEYEAYKDQAKKLRDSIKAALQLAEFDAERAKPAAEIGLQLLRVADEVSRRYDEQKEQLQMLDFGDLMSRARQLLGNPANRELVRQLQGRIRLLLVDEFQDTDPIQVELVRALTGEGISQGELFFVGDFKQSIYRFRGAQPEVFRQLESEMPAEGRLPLSTNFRSQPAILDFVNALFAPCFAPDYQPLLPSRKQVGPRPAVEFLWARSFDFDSAHRPQGVEAMRRAEADWIARRVRQLLDSPEAMIHTRQDGQETARRVAPGDIALLFRALSDVQYYEEALRAYGIDYYLVGGHAFYAQQEIFDVLNLLRSVASPADQVSLAGVLRSPIFACTDETLFWLAQHENGLGEGLFAADLPDALDATARERVKFAAGVLAELRACKDRLPIAELLRLALQRTGYDAALLSEFLGERKLANLYKLIDQARPFDRAGAFGLDDYITQLSRFVVSQPKEALAATHPETTDVVRLMTIHASKGLEFPVVILPDLERRAGGMTDPVLFHADLGPLVKADDDAVVGHKLLSAVEAEEDAQETTRLFYVACTRAADYLILSSCIADFDALKGAWTSLLAERFDLESGARRDPEQIGAQEALVRVIRERPEVAMAPRRLRAPRVSEEVLQKAIDRTSKPALERAATASPAPRDRSARRAYSFSRLSGLLQLAEPAPDPADYSTRPSGGDALAFGSLLHEVLQRMRLDCPEEAATILADIAPRHFANPAAALREAGPVLEEFLKSDCFGSLRSAKQVHRELEFMLAWPPEHPTANGVYLQGFLDCLYQDEAGDWRIVDFKTNRVTSATLDAVAEGYRLQLYVYALAVEQAWGESPRELVLHFLRGGFEASFAWDDAARRKVRGMIDDAIAADRKEV
ncbi:MAG: UvrD-helicase domain-containing protein [Planctomycetales bacterium]|nr:UvrD-helicase domain-containing protein [Planctomycetales bacterium]